MIHPLRETQIYRIDKIVKDAGFGGTCPIIVQANGTEYVLKTKEDGTNTTKSLGILNEMLAYQLLSVLGYKIAPQEVVYLWIDDNFIEAAEIACREGVIKAESLEFIRESEGVNIGVEYLHYAMDPLNTIDNQKFIKDVLHIDNYILNCDRTTDNPNILQDRRHKRKFYAIDFGNALADGVAYSKIINGELEDTLQLGKVINCNATLSGRYLFRNVENPLVKKGRRIKGDIVKIRQIIETVFDTFPPESEWEPMRHRSQIADIVVHRLKNKNIFHTGRSSKCECII